MNAQTASFPRKDYVIASTILTYSNLSHLPVINRETAKGVGRVGHLWIDLDTHKIDSITCKASLLGRTAHTFKWSQIDTFGKDSLLVNLPESQAGEKVEGAAEMTGRELWTDTGAQVGIISDYIVDPRNGAVIVYLFDVEGQLGALGGQFQLPPSAISHVDSQRIIAAVAAVREAEIWSSI